MGNYTKTLFKKKREVTDTSVSQEQISSTHTVTRIVSCGIMRDGEIHKGYRSHADIRRQLGDENPYLFKKTDTEGFITSEGLFVDRDIAKHIASAAGQCTHMARELLSSDIHTW